ncbi:MFS transporter [Stygiolobus caldivivus]|uniref:MFS transporter n=1 Tax=Stygiolobus caldivivus TaxID=2824673 RepID=UPI001C857216|nr:MFS transporter [Stygiolobus caldivivus]
MRGIPILIARAIYGISWFFLSPYLPYLIKSLDAPPYFTNLVPISFFASAAIMQVPAGIISTKLGMKKTYTLGLIIMGIGDSLIGLSPNIYTVLAFYAMTGFGASFFFSSAGGTLAVVNEGKVATVLGLYNAMFAVGGIIGLNWGFLDALLGFSYASLFLGAVTVVMGFLNWFSVYPNNKPDFRVIKDLRVVVIALATSGVWGAYYVVSEYFPSFTYYVLGKSAILTGSVSSVLLLSSVLGGTLTGLFENKDKVKGIVFTGILGVLPSILLYTDFYEIGLFIMGLFNELCISIIYSLVVNFVKSQNSSLSLAVVNAIQIGVGMNELLLPSITGFYVWVAVSIVSIIPLLLLLVVWR